jgi:hypothetical protein
MRALATPFTFLPSYSQLEPERCAKPLQRLSSLISLGIFFSRWLSLILSCAGPSGQGRRNCEACAVDGRVILIGDIEVLGRRRLHNTRRNGDGRMNVRVSVTLLT